MISEQSVTKKLDQYRAWFIGDNRQSLKLTTKPEPYTLDRTLRWVQRQVAPTLKMLKKIDKGTYRQFHGLRLCTPAVFRRYGGKCN